MAALDTLVQHGKVRYIGCSNYSAWHVMKSLAAADRRHAARFATQQIHYTLEAREAEYELLPLSVAEGLGVLVWSPLAAGLLSGKHRRGAARPGRLAPGGRLGRAADPRFRAALEHRRRARPRSARRTACRPRASRSPGC